MSLLNDVQKFIEAHPGCTSGDIADAFAGYSRQRVLQYASNAATVWMAAFRESHSQPERNNFLARRERCLRKSSKRAASGEEWYLSGNYVGA